MKICHPLVTSILLSLFGPLVSAQTPRSFVNISEVVENWSPDQHVWISGNLPLSESNRSALEQWIATEAPNWTVVLLENARTQQFHSYRGIDAVEQALGTGLSNQTSFGNQIHPVTGESNGAIFVLFWSERKLSYFASDAYDKRQLGESQWIGRLDRPAIDAMRGGSRIADAARNTIKSIEAKLAKAIAREEEAKQHAAIEKELRLEKAKSLPARLDERLKEVSDKATVFRNRYSDFRGTLAYPSLSTWRSQRNAVSSSVTSGQVQEAFDQFHQTNLLIDEYEQNLRDWVAAHTGIENLDNQLVQFNPEYSSPEIEGFLSQAADSLQSARVNHRFGDPIYLSQMEAAHTAMARAESEENAYQERRNAEIALAEAQRVRAKARRIRSGTFGVACSALLLGGLLLLNRRRRQSKIAAHQAYREWKSRLRGKFDRLFDLMDRTSIMQRSSEAFVGQSDALTKETIRQVDELFIISSATDYVMDQVNNLIEPRVPWTYLINTVSSRNYRKAIALLDSRVIGFRRHQQLREILYFPGKNRKRDLLGEESAYQPFSLSFKQLIEVYDEKESAARKDLKRLERCVAGLPLTIEQITSTLEALSQQVTNTEDDEYFPFEKMRDHLLPTVETKIDEAVVLAKNDPVAAFEGPVATASRLLSDAEKLVIFKSSAAGAVLPRLDELARLMEDFEISSEWIHEEFQTIAESFEQLCQLAVDQPVSDRIENLDSELSRLTGRVNDSVDLAKQLREDTPLSIESAEKNIFDLRKDLSAKLELPFNEVAAEAGLNPRDRIDQARQAIVVIKQALCRGNIDLARSSFPEIERLLAESNDLVEIAKDIYQNGPTMASEIENEIEELKTKLPEVSNILEDLTRDYDPSVLLFSERFGHQVSGQRSIENNIPSATDHLKNAQSLLETMRESFQQGDLISAGAALDRSLDEVGFASHQIALIQDQYEELKRIEEKNERELDDWLFRYRSSRAKVENEKTTERTIALYRAFPEKVAPLMDKGEVTRKNPFGNARLLQQLSREFGEWEESLKIDWDWHATATAEVERTQRLLDGIEKLVHRARHDGYPDSRKLSRAIRAHGRLERSLLDWQVYLSSAHRDWEKAYRGANDIETEASEIKGVIEKQLKLAKSAAASLQEAAHAISALKNWRGGYRDSVERSAGESLYIRAREAQSNGDYRSAVSSAMASRQQAEAALSEANSNVRRAKAAEEAARRRRAAAVTSMGISQRARRSSRSSPARARRSQNRGSRGSTGSGFSRSGW